MASTEPADGKVQPSPAAAPFAPTVAVVAAPTATIEWLRALWLWRYLPVICQPEVDITNRNSLLGMFYQWVDGPAGSAEGGDELHLCLVYEGEASYNRGRPTVMNALGTFCYRSFNFSKYNRTADLKYLRYRRVDLHPMAPRGWASIDTTDAAGTQDWANGDKSQFLWIYALVHHYTRSFPCDTFTTADKLDAKQLAPAAAVPAAAPAPDSKAPVVSAAAAAVPSAELKPSASSVAGSRPVIYLCTSNHMMGTADANPLLVKRVWTTYRLWPGDRHAAERFGQTCVPVKANLFVWCLSCRSAEDPANPLGPNCNGYRPRRFSAQHKALLMEEGDSKANGNAAPEAKPANGHANGNGRGNGNAIAVTIHPVAAAAPAEQKSPAPAKMFTSDFAHPSRSWTPLKPAVAHVPFAENTNVWRCCEADIKLLADHCGPYAAADPAPAAAAAADKPAAPQANGHANGDARPVAAPSAAVEAVPTAVPVAAAAAVPVPASA